jgi:hypothetical protein
MFRQCVDEQHTRKLTPFSVYVVNRSPLSNSISQSKSIVVAVNMKIPNTVGMSVRKPVRYHVRSSERFK